MAKARQQKKSGAAGGREMKPWKFVEQLRFLNDYITDDTVTASNVPPPKPPPPLSHTGPSS